MCRDNPKLHCDPMPCDRTFSSSQNEQEYFIHETLLPPVIMKKVSVIYNHNIG